MAVAVGQAAQITDTADRAIGRFEIDEIKGGLLLGTFHPGPDFAAVEGLIYRFADLVEDQVLSLVDEAQAAIDTLGIRLNGAPVWDVQIYRDGGASFRLPKAIERNGSHH